MTKIICTSNCNNAPKQIFIKDFCTALAKKELETAFDMLADDILVEIPCYTSARGIEAVKKLLQKDAGKGDIKELILEKIISHGKYGAANGILKFTDGSTVYFCNMYAFNSHGRQARLKEIKSYSITSQ